MFAYLIKCFLILLSLWFARSLHLIPWDNTINLVLIVIVPMLIAAGAWRSGWRLGERRGKGRTLRGLASDLGVYPNSHQSETADQDHRRTSL